MEAEGNVYYKDLSMLWHLQALWWSSDRGHLKAWQRGGTGYPLVDAAMRQLWLTGWMNNYMRHVVASFLIAYLHLPWQEGYRWFQVRHPLNVMYGSTPCNELHVLTVCDVHRTP